MGSSITIVDDDGSQFYGGGRTKGTTTEGENKKLSMMQEKSKLNF